MGFTLEQAFPPQRYFAGASSASFPRACCLWYHCTSGIWRAARKCGRRRHSALQTRPCNAQYGVFGAGRQLYLFALGLGFTALGRFFSDNRALFARIGGVLIILFGLYQLGVFRSRALSTERRLPIRLDRLSMNPAVAFLFGFTFSLRGRRASARHWAACSSWQRRLALPHRAFCSSAYIRWGSCCRSWR